MIRTVFKDFNFTTLNNVEVVALLTFSEKVFAGLKSDGFDLVGIFAHSKSLALGMSNGKKARRQDGRREEGRG